MVSEETRHRAIRLGIKYPERMEKSELIRSIQALEGRNPCFDQQRCRPSLHQLCSWKDDCRAQLEPVCGLILTNNVIIGHQIATLLSSSHGWRMKIIHKDRQAYALIQQGEMDVVVADIDGIDLGGLAVLAYAQKEDLFLKKLARDMGGCRGFFYRIKGKMELDTHTGMVTQLLRQASGRHAPNISYVSATK